MSDEQFLIKNIIKQDVRTGEGNGINIRIEIDQRITRGQLMDNYSDELKVASMGK